MKSKIKKLIFISLAAVAVLAVGGYVAALSGWFGGGAAIPEDTMTRGLVGYWSFDEGGGQVAKDLSGNGNNGTLGAAATAGADDPLWSKGKNGGGLKFDGVNDYVDVGEKLDGLSSGTIELWVKPSSFINFATIWKENSVNDSYLRLSGTGGGFIFHLAFTGGDLYSVSNLSLNNWNHIVTAFGSSGMNIYINGKLDNSNGVTGVVETYLGRTFKLGSAAWSSQFFNGTIDEVRIYNRALSAEEVRYHYNRGGPVAEWKFDEGSGTTIYDSTENNKDGVLHE